MIFKKNAKKYQELEELVGLSKADLHIHITNSTVQEFLDYVQEKTDLSVVAVTDHNSIEKGLEAKSLIGQKNYRFEVIVGEEISTKEGHVLGLFLNETIEPFLPCHEVIKEIKRQGGLAIAAHPFQEMKWGKEDQILMDGVGLKTLLGEKKNWDGIEVVNATPTLADENWQASLINNTLLWKAETGSSDAHILEAIGKGYTLFKGKTAQDLRDAILQRKTQAGREKWTIKILIKYGFFFLPDVWHFAPLFLKHFLQRKKS